MVPAPSVGRLGGGGPDLAALYERFDEQFDAASSVDRARFLAAATRAALSRHDPYAACRVLLLDVPIVNASERALVEAPAVRAPHACATVPAGDVLTGRPGPLHGPNDRRPDAEASTGCGSISSRPRRGSESLAEVELFSAPGEGRGAEIARRVVREAGVACRSIGWPSLQAYATLCRPARHALDRAACPPLRARHPSPASGGRVFSRSCAARWTTCRRGGAEYCRSDRAGPTAGAEAPRIPTSTDEVFGAAGGRGELAQEQSDEAGEGRRRRRRSAGVRAPWKWERLSPSRASWPRRSAGTPQNGLVAECALQRTGSPGARCEARAAVARSIRRHRRSRPLMRGSTHGRRRRPGRNGWRSSTPRRRVLKRRIACCVWPISVDGSGRPDYPRGGRRGLAVGSRRSRPSAGAAPRPVLVTTPAEARRSFDIVFIPASPSGCFPELREDPLLLDDARAQPRRR